MPYTNCGSFSTKLELFNFFGLNPDSPSASAFNHQRAKLTSYNITEAIVNHTIIKQGDTRYEYKMNFSMAAHICRIFLRLTTEKDSIDVISLLQKELIPIRNKRQYPRLQTAIPKTTILYISCGLKQLYQHL